MSRMRRAEVRGKQQRRGLAEVTRELYRLRRDTATTAVEMVCGQRPLGGRGWGYIADTLSCSAYRLPWEDRETWRAAPWEQQVEMAEIVARRIAAQIEERLRQQALGRQGGGG